MLNSETKRHIDAARDVMVGVAPNPMTQIDQITYALIYKFMDDMDQASINAGGEPSFFVGELEPYAWSRLLDSRMGNQERMNLYGEALQKFSEAKQLPELFRTIFRAAFLPYRSPETLALFLKEISHFNYSHPEELGNAYEYLLSIMSSQGDAGQFRTPRHIIDFMVDVMNPTKDDRVLDPACGTGGFLVASYNHILEQHDGKDDPNKTEQPLTPDERKKLMNNLEGYDIDPSMVRIAQVNMYLHQFKNPRIFQYDSLTSEERWNDKFDVILANPPFMSPKGGIRPHSKFAIQSNRSEVLFVDYIANHLKTNGRAGIIVPEGIIFQSGKAYKQLRKELVEGGLYAVVSLPSGVFNPYSGVKTSILLINSEIANKRDEILFIKISADGFDLGANKRAVKSNDLPEALKLLKNWRDGDDVESPLCSSVTKYEIADRDFSLSADRYRSDYKLIKSAFERTSIQKLETDGALKLLRGSNLSKSDIHKFGKHACIHYGELYTVYGTRIEFVHSKTDIEGKVRSVAGDVLVPATTTADSLGISIGRSLDIDDVIIGGDINIVRTRNEEILGSFLAYLISYPPLKLQLAQYAKGTNIIHLSNNDLRLLEFPLPPIGAQERIVAELDGYAAIVDGAEKVLENWKPRIEIDPKWTALTLSEFASVKGGKRLPKGQSFSPVPTNFRYFRVSDFAGNSINRTHLNYLSSETFDALKNYAISSSDVYISIAGTIGTVGIIPPDLDGQILTENAARIVIDNPAVIDKEFLMLVLQSDYCVEQIRNSTQTVGVPKLGLNKILSLEIPTPSLEIQQSLISAVNEERLSIKAAQDLRERYEARIAKVINSLWNQ